MSEPAIKRKRKSTNDDTHKRPSNAFILYRNWQHSIVAAANPGMDNSLISKTIGANWKNLTDLERDYWHEKADQLSLEHARLHPDSKYKINIRQIQKKIQARAERAAAAKAEAEAKAQAQVEEQLQPAVGGQTEPEQQHGEQVEEPQVPVENIEQPPVQLSEQPQEQFEFPEEFLEQFEIPEELQKQTDL
ncbi:high mobility group box domain-containing protein [Xylaria grammica]|nr:high mobility group box domain-containing protein [Xylaria grammica]